MSAFPLSSKTLRWLGLLLITGCAVLAADNRWLGLNSSFRPATDWLSVFYSAPTPNIDARVAAESSATSRRSDLSMAEMLNGLLFSPPAQRTSWRLDPPPVASRFSWLTQQNREAFTYAPGYEDQSSGFSAFGPLGYSALGGAPAAPDGGPPPPPGFWTANASGSWDNPSNWKDGIIANGGTATAHFETLDITTDVTVTLDSSRIIGNLVVGDSNGSHRYTIAQGSGGERLIFNNASQTALLQQTSTSGGDTISVPVALSSDLEISNLSTAHPFQISGNIAPNGFTGTTRTVTLEGTVNISGNITTGINGADLSLVVSGNVNLSGTNTYGGLTFVTGTLFVKGNNSFADGSVQVSGGGSVLSGTGTIGGIVTIQGGTITAGTSSTVGHLTLLQSVNFQATQGGGATLLANLSDDVSDLLSVTGTFNIGNGNTLNIQGTADGTTTYTLATYLSHTGMFDNVLGLPSGYELLYLPGELVLAPIPEPATWIGAAAAAAGAIALRFRRRRKA